MTRRLRKTFRLDPEDVQALKRAEADGISTSELVRRGLRVVAADYYDKGERRRPPKVGLFVPTDPHLGEESQLYTKWEDHAVTHHAPLLESTRRAKARFKARGGSSLEEVMRRFGRLRKRPRRAIGRPSPSTARRGSRRR